MADETRQLGWKTGCTRRRAARRDHRQLVRELAEYRTVAERRDLLATVGRCSSPACEEVRRLLTATAAVQTEREGAPYHLQH